jgi:hypothetical protein
VRDGEKSAKTLSFGKTFWLQASIQDLIFTMNNIRELGKEGCPIPNSPAWTHLRKILGYGKMEWKNRAIAWYEHAL